MPRLQAKSFATPDDVRATPNVRFETISLDEATVGHCRFEPGWRWSTEFASQLGLASCPIRHLGYSISGWVRVRMDDGEMLDIGPDMVFDIPPGHDQWVIGDEPWITVEWGASGRALSEALEESNDRSLATVLFTDIVDSTAKLELLGDAAWRDLLAAHNVRLREQLNIFRGREVKTTGDGFLAVFDSPTRAVRCAAAMPRAIRSMGLDDPGRRAHRRDRDCRRRCPGHRGTRGGAGARACGTQRGHGFADDGRPHRGLWPGARGHRRAGAQGPLRHASRVPADRRPPALPDGASLPVRAMPHGEVVSGPAYRCDSMIVPIRATAVKWSSLLRTTAPARAAVAAIQMSLVGIGLPAWRRSSTMSA